jgi:hypothetical protein
VVDAPQAFKASWASQVKIKILVSECKTSGTYAKRAKQTTNKDTPQLAFVFWAT